MQFAPRVGGSCLLCYTLCSLYLCLHRNLNLKVFHLLFPLLAFSCFCLGLLLPWPVHEGIHGQDSEHSMLLLEGLNVFVLARKFSKSCSCLFRLHCACLCSGTRLWFVALSHSRALKRWRCSGNPLERRSNKLSVKRLFINCLVSSNIDFYFSFNFLYKELLKILCFQLYSYTTVHRNNIFQTGSSW